MRPSLYGLYAITSAAICRDEARLVAAVSAALAGGVRWIQYRDKAASPAQRRDRAAALTRLCHAQQAGLIINDDVDLARSSGADGVHIGASDGDIAAARRALGPGRILGVTCGNDLVRARQAVALGADYVAFGRLFASRTKPDAPPASLTTVRQAAQSLSVPVCAIGGILPEHLPEVSATGAQLIAVIEGIFGSNDIESAARHYIAGSAPYNCGSD